MSNLFDAGFHITDRAAHLAPARYLSLARPAYLLCWHLDNSSLREGVHDAQDDGQSKAAAKADA
jgi:hypothetical protein